ncbi:MULTISPECIES: GntR family transcriptional regulator [unclassified Methylobacterium]|uniref:GntR family transcriptional regulator n=1 Tax=unclassified Methylobacterium TaxID=2615210 RepID=UPI00143BAD76|nr:MULTISPECIES: GntR family transcriptional regulator [Methylobacterium]WFT79062.1 GntR family transcriptional regulator [Methylobacterium nodulans]
MVIAKANGQALGEESCRGGTASPHDSAVEPAAAPSLRDQAYEVLEELITLRVLPAGSLLSETSLSKKLGFGRTPIREALLRLSLEGLVVVLPRRGIIVAEIDTRTQLKILEIRAELERLVVRHAARLAAPAQRTRMRALADEITATAHDGDGRAFMQVLRECHAITAEAADNEILADMIRRVHGLSRRFWFAHYEKYGSLEKAAELHAARLIAMARGEPEQAASSSDHLVEYLEKFTRSTLGIAV